MVPQYQIHFRLAPFSLGRAYQNSLTVRDSPGAAVAVLEPPLPLQRSTGYWFHFWETWIFQVCWGSYCPSDSPDVVWPHNRNYKQTFLSRLLWWKHGSCPEKLLQTHFITKCTIDSMDRENKVVSLPLPWAFCPWKLRFFFSLLFLKQQNSHAFLHRKGCKTRAQAAQSRGEVPIPGGAQKPCSCGTWGQGLVVDLVVVLGWWLGLVILKVFSTLNNSLMLQTPFFPYPW